MYAEQPKQPPHYQESLKTLTKLFNKTFQKQDIRIILEFSEFDLIQTFKILTVISNSEKAAPVIKQLLDKPDKSDKLLMEQVEKYDNSPFVNHPLPPAILKLTQGDEQDKKPVKKQKVMMFFKKLPPKMLMQILVFLTPIEITQFLKMEPEFPEAYLSNNKKRIEYYKGICDVLFCNAVPKLPEPSHFAKLKEYVISHPKEFGPNIRHAAQNDMRLLVWHCTPESFLLEKEYYMAVYGDYEKIYHSAPRVNFNGFYVFREKYSRRGEYSLEAAGLPYYVVYYYRYMRFFPDGSILYKLSNRRLTPEEIRHHLSSERFFDESDEIIKGQFMQFKQQLYIRFSRSTSLFCYDCLIETNENPFDTLRIQRFGLQLIDDTMMAQELYREKPHQQQKTFVYMREPVLASENLTQIQICSL